MKTTIEIKKLKIPVLVGTDPAERRKKQVIAFDIALDYDSSKAVRSDDLFQAVDYERLADVLAKEISKTRFLLLEKLADHALKTILKDPRIQNASVKVYKPKAIRNAETVSVRVSREQ